MTNEQMIKGLERLIKKTDDPEAVFFYGHALTKIKNIEKCKPKLCKNCEFWVSQDKEVERINRVETQADYLYKYILEMCPSNRERSIAIIKLEESVTWATKSVAHEKKGRR